MQCFRSAADPYRIGDSAIFGKLLFEEMQVFAENEIASIEHPGDRRLYLPRDGRPLRLKVD